MPKAGSTTNILNMLIIFADHPDFGEIAHARYMERRRLISFAYSIISKFPEQFTSSKKKYKIATEICNKFYKEIYDKFNSP